MDGEGYQSGYGPLSAHTEAAVPRHPCCIPSAASQSIIPGATSQINHPTWYIPNPSSHVPHLGYHSLGTTFPGAQVAMASQGSCRTFWQSGAPRLFLPAQPKVCSV